MSRQTDLQDRSAFPYGSLSDERPHAEDEGRSTSVMTALHFAALRDSQVESLMRLEAGGEAVFIQDAGGRSHKLSAWIRARAN